MKMEWRTDVSLNKKLIYFEMYVINQSKYKVLKTSTVSSPYA